MVDPGVDPGVDLGVDPVVDPGADPVVDPGASFCWRARAVAIRCADACDVCTHDSAMQMVGLGVASRVAVF